MGRWKHERTRLVYRRGNLRVMEDSWTLPSGVRVVYPLFRRPDFAVAVGLTDDHEIPMIENLHPSPGLHLLELPGGWVEPRESPRAAARRELEEETGWHAGKLSVLGRYYPTPHAGTYQGHYFLGESLRPGPPRPETDESLRSVLLPVGEVYRRLRAGRFLGGGTLVGLYLAEASLRSKGFLAPVDRG